ncbi:triacylglycerol lipase family protein [Aspergillus clavatus NRRL 1]|uniref:Patatin-like serine hydrolase, putative n=1 Tax=Aspergillus clavatus (strain ATCC 1007 / CBS 513.65 / DSM 816 / NCTC 3887 / NRRL 1 / QM 1276 / 107) TaxID=344612 RepID=A1CQJ8_ASPCL|nr:Patatin-like serine hydrolase, putative [Aspergillus clavatus NRRL 1]EAW07919.1 Patatin-like serine hydrolase, putative [Aspergillus clavatus NRRL 1]
MKSWTDISGLFAAIVSMLLDVALFWKYRLMSWWLSKSPQTRLRHSLATAQSYEEWEEAAFELDEYRSADLWRQNPTSRHYDYRLILGRLEALMTAREEEDILTLANLLRSGLVRNLGNITSPKLFLHAFAGTKLLIDDYITQVALSIQHITGLHTAPIHDSGFTSQAKLELLHDTRQAFGRTTLLLQGGSIFGLCHLGIVKALYLQGLLPRIITGTGTGALIAALVGIHTEDELLSFLDRDGIDLTAFDRRRKETPSDKHGFRFPYNSEDGWLATLFRRVKRYLQKGYFLDAEVLDECVRANLGDLTFEEAYARSKRILNITIATSGKNGTPHLLNYLTAPNVLIWSAAVASNASATSLFKPVTIYCKDETGSIVPWPHSQDATFRSWRHIHYNDGESPLSRIAELFNVNHFIVSQARPYLVPFLGSDLNLIGRQHTGRWNITRPLMRLVAAELRHRLRQLDYIGVLPQAIGRLLIEETIPGSNLTLVPELSLGDFPKLLQNPSKDSLAYWILKGERGVWRAISALKVRCVIEIELDKGYQLVRRRRPSENHRRAPNEGVPRRRRGYSIDNGRDVTSLLASADYQPEVPGS